MIFIRRTAARALAALLVLAASTAADARPFRGSVAWAFLLCRYTDSAVPEPEPPQHYQDMLLTPNVDGAADYWRDMSAGEIDLRASLVRGWITIPMTLAQARAKGGGANPRRGEVIDDCVTAARRARSGGHDLRRGENVAVITWPGVDIFGSPGRVMLAWDVQFVTILHEMGHGFGLDHSYSDDPKWRSAAWSGIGEYDDDWDIMGNSWTYQRPTAQFGGGGPGLNAYNRDHTGWLPISRTFTFGQDGKSSAAVTLAALGHANATGYFLVRVPFDRADPFHYYTVEYRRKEGWDLGFPSDVVLIHEIMKKGDGAYHAAVLRERTGARKPVQRLEANGVSIAVTSVAGDQAVVQIATKFPTELALRTYGPNACKPGYVWRAADALDYVCVPPQSRDQAWADNKLAAARRGPGNPGACLGGFVERLAFRDDHVCTTPAARAQAGRDNAAAPARYQLP